MTFTPLKPSAAVAERIAELRMREEARLAKMRPEARAAKKRQSGD